MRIIHVVLLCLLPSFAQAGAWPRDRGTAFISLSQEFLDTPWGIDSKQSIYAEYGATERLTLGVRGTRRADGLSYSAVAFARYPLGPADWSNRFAVELGLGARWDVLGGYEYILRPVFHWGRGFTAPQAIGFLGTGWMGLELTAGHNFGNDLYDPITYTKADLTLGFTPRDQTHLILQLRSHHDRYSSSYSIAPSVVHRFMKTLKVELGGNWQLSDDADHSVTVATWIEF